MRKLLALAAIAILCLGAGKVPRGTVNYVAVGDSITAYPTVTSGSYPTILSVSVTDSANYFSIQDVAVSGYRVSNLVSAAAATDALLLSGYTNKLSVLIGVNDFLIEHDTVATYLAELSAYLDARRTAGWKVAICTLTPATAAAVPDVNGVSYATWSGQANTTIRTWVGVHANAFCDFAALGLDPSDTLLFSDGLHLTNAGQEILTTVIVPALAGMKLDLYPSSG